jgi:hypothetical protein
MTYITKHTSASPSWVIKNTLCVSFIAASVIPNPMKSSVNLVSPRLMEEASSSRLKYLNGGAQIRYALRVAQIRAIRGKYAFVPTSSEEFAFHKQKEIELER